MRRHCLPFNRLRFSARLLGAIGLAALSFTALSPAASAAIDEHLGQGMPLVLKDGRIANVTVHTIPFATGAEALDPAAAAAAEAAFRPFATDCFLTAQTIGHVAPGITRDGDTLAAHRLARARADGIQAMLAGLGMPQPAVASVWDWQFLVQESQVTLWVFSLNVGDDCEGVALPIEAPALAAADGPALTAEAAEPLDEASVGAVVAGAAAAGSAAAEAAAGLAELPGDAAPRELRVADAEPDRAAPEAAVVEAAPAVMAEAAPPAGERVGAVLTDAELAAAALPKIATRDAAEPDTALSDAAPGDVEASPDPLATTAVAPAGSSAVAAMAEPLAAAEAAPELTQAALEPEATAPVGDTEAPDLVITFDVNSSFFPEGAVRELRAFVARLPEAAPLELELLGAVGTGDVRGASGEEAQRYNAWMAERRVQRVAEWLSENAGRPVTMTERLVENDPSREVRLFTSVVR